MFRYISLLIMVLFIIFFCLFHYSSSNTIAFESIEEEFEYYREQVLDNLEEDNLELVKNYLLLMEGISEEFSRLDNGLDTIRELKILNKRYEIATKFKIDKPEDLVGTLIEITDAVKEHGRTQQIVRNVYNVNHDFLRLYMKKNGSLRIIPGYITSQPEFSSRNVNIPGDYRTYDELPGVYYNSVTMVSVIAEVGIDLHELGHGVDNLVFERVSTMPAFREIWKEEVDSLLGNHIKLWYFQSSPEEYFAEAFVMIYTSESTRANVKRLAPRTHDFFVELEMEAAERVAAYLELLETNTVLY